MEADPASERVSQPQPAQAESQRSAWELIDEEWGETDEVPMCM